MDGGVDAAITDLFGDQLQQRVQRYILDHFDGEQPVGTSFIISTANPKHPYVAHTPTMVTLSTHPLPFSNPTLTLVPPSPDPNPDLESPLFNSWHRLRVLCLQSDAQGGP